VRQFAHATRVQRPTRSSTERPAPLARRPTCKNCAFSTPAAARRHPWRGPGRVQGAGVRSLPDRARAQEEPRPDRGHRPRSPSRRRRVDRVV